MPAVTLMLPGIVGGVFLAILLFTLTRRSAGGTPLPRRKLEPLTTDLINMAHIRVAGIGGLCMMAAGVVIAVYVPEIGWALGTSIGLGAALAVGLILHRERALKSSSGGGDSAPPAGLLSADRLSSPPFPPSQRPSGDRPVAIA